MMKFKVLVAALALLAGTAVAGANDFAFFSLEGSSDPNVTSEVVNGQTTVAGEGVAHNNLHPYQCTTFMIYAGAGTHRFT